jgi:hypothetical protein
MGWTVDEIIGRNEDMIFTPDALAARHSRTNPLGLAG